MLVRLILVFLILVAVLMVGYFSFKALPTKAKMTVLVWIARLLIGGSVAALILVALVALF